MIVSMIYRLAVGLLLTAAISPQRAETPNVRIFFPEGHAEGASMTYGVHLPETDRYYLHFGERMSSGQSFFEISAATDQIMPSGWDRFKALIWSRGCKMERFDVPVQKSDVNLQFSCDPLKTVTISGRIRDLKISENTTISVNYTAFATCIWMDAPTTTAFVRCGGPQIQDVGRASIAQDGTFKIEVPDFTGDPTADDSTAELEFCVNGIEGHPLLQLEGSQSPTIKVASSYPNVVLVPVKMKRPF